MSKNILNDAIAGIPDNARLRKDINTHLKRIEELEAEVASLKDDKRKLQSENEELKRSQNKLGSIEIEILKAISAHDSLNEQEIAEMFKLNLQLVRFQITKLEKELKLIEGIRHRSQRGRYRLTHKGREWLVANHYL